MTGAVKRFGARIHAHQFKVVFDAIPIAHGDHDLLVPHHQSVLLEAALKEARVPVTFHTVEGAGHGFRDPAANKLLIEFFAKHLKGQ